MKLGILGTGMIVKALMNTIDRLNIEAISILGTEMFREETEEIVKKHHLKDAFYDYDELLAADVDTIYVALPNHLHYPFAKKALEQGKHVIIEKPVTCNEKELKDLIAVAQEKHRMLFEAMNLHYLPSYLALKEDVKQLGDIKIVSFNYSQYSSRYDSFREGNVLPAFDPHKAGGALMDINIYNVHGIMGLFGTPQSVKYYANVERGIDTSGMMLYDYGSFKAVSIGAKDCKAPVRSMIQGNQGAIVIEKPISQMSEYRILYNDGREERREFGQTEHRLYYEFVEFIRMIDENDYEAYKAKLKLSLAISGVVTEARLAEGIVFDQDGADCGR